MFFFVVFVCLFFYTQTYLYLCYGDTFTYIEMDPRWKHPFTAVISGPTSCGKSVFVKRFIQHLSEMVVPMPDEVIYCYSEYQPSFDSLKDQGVKFIEGLPDVDEWPVDRKRLIILDDLMNETDERVTRLFTKISHHRSLSVIQIVQNLFSKNKEQRTISLNSHYLVVFKNPRDKSQIINLGKQIYPGMSKFVNEAFISATQTPNSYILFDLRQETSEDLRLRTNIFPGELHTVFVPKKN